MNCDNCEKQKSDWILVKVEGEDYTLCDDCIEDIIEKVKLKNEV